METIPINEKPINRWLKTRDPFSHQRGKQGKHWRV